MAQVQFTPAIAILNSRTQGFCKVLVLNYNVSVIRVTSNKKLTRAISNKPSKWHWKTSERS